MCYKMSGKEMSMNEQTPDEALLGFLKTYRPSSTSSAPFDAENGWDD